MHSGKAEKGQTEHCFIFFMAGRIPISAQGKGKEWI
jgi:hypothetical protein